MGNKHTSSLSEMLKSADLKELKINLYATETDGTVSVSFDISLELLKDLALYGDKYKLGLAFLEAIADEIDK